MFHKDRYSWTGLKGNVLWKTKINNYISFLSMPSFDSFYTFSSFFNNHHFIFSNFTTQPKPLARRQEP